MQWHSALLDEAAADDDGTGLRTASLVGFGSALPETRADNTVIGPPAGVEASWIERRTGIRERRHAAAGPDTTTELATEAARAALDDAGIAAAEVDLVVVGTMTPDRACPQVAPLVAHRLGATGAAAFDVAAACTAWLSALATAGAQVEAGRAHCALIIGVDVLSRVLDPTDKMTAPLFADGAGAAVLVAGDGGGRLGPVVLASDGSDAELITCGVGGTIAMDGHATFRRAVGAMTGAATRVCDRAGIAVSDLDLVVPHQANARITAAVAERLGLPLDRIVDDIAEVGNTSAATLPLALARAHAAGRLPVGGGRVLLAAFGAGLTWGAALLDWEATETA